MGRLWRCNEPVEPLLALGVIIDVLRQYRARGTFSIVPVGGDWDPVPYAAICDAAECILRMHIPDMCLTRPSDPYHRDNPHSDLVDEWLHRGERGGFWSIERANRGTYVKLSRDLEKIVAAFRKVHPYDKISEAMWSFLDYGTGSDEQYSLRTLTKSEYFTDEYPIYNIRKSTGFEYVCGILKGDQLESYFNRERDSELRDLCSDPSSPKILENLWPPSHQAMERFLRDSCVNNMKARGIIYSPSSTQLQPVVVCASGYVHKVEFDALSEKYVMYVQFGVHECLPVVLYKDGVLVDPYTKRGHGVRVASVPWHGGQGIHNLIALAILDRLIAFPPTLWLEDLV